MKKTIATALVASTLALAPMATASADTSKGTDHGCVDTPEWFDLQEGLDDPIRGGARRSVIEESWKVTPVGLRNQYFQPAGDKVYSYAYNFCQNPEVLVILVFRKTSGAWQMALKGGFVG